MLAQPDIDVLERLIALYSLGDVLASLAHICRDRSEAANDPRDERAWLAHARAIEHIEARL